MADDYQTQLEAVPPELPFELQSKLFDQLGTIGIAGAGLVVTLRSSILESASGIIWLAAIEFGLAAMIALSAQIQLINGLFARHHDQRTSRVLTVLALVLIGMGTGTLGTSVLLEGRSAPKTAQH